MRSLHTTTALLELGAGLALLFFPSEFSMLMVGGSLETPVALTVARIGASGLIALGVACWIARNDAISLATLALVAAMLFYNFAAVAVFTYAGLGLHLHGVGLWPAAIGCVAIAIAVYAASRRAPARAAVGPGIADPATLPGALATPG